MPLDRRDFLRSSALAGFALPFLGGFPLPVLPGARTAARAAMAPGGLAGMAATADGLRLLRHSGAPVAPALRESLGADVNLPLAGNMALLGGMMPASVDQLCDLVGRLRTRWPERQGAQEEEGGEEEAFLPETLALAAGWVLHRAAHAKLKAVHDAAADPDEARLYHDAALLRAWSGHAPGAAPEAEVPAEEVATLLRLVVPRTLIRFHTLVPDYDDGAGWVTRLAAWRDHHADWSQRLAAAYAQPDPAKLERYVAAPNFYDPADPIIEQAALLREAPTVEVGGAEEGEEGEVKEEARTVEVPSAPGGSLYAQALRQGLDGLMAISAYLEGEASKADLRERIASA